MTAVGASDAMIEKCQNCGLRLFGGGIRDEFGNFCSTVRRDNFAHPGFCQACIAATTPASATDNLTVWPFGFGTTFLGPSRDRCPTCGSTVKSQWLRMFFVIPLYHIGTYRVKYVAPNRFVTREIPKKAKG